jgi:VanZ family protein
VIEEVLTVEQTFVDFCFSVNSVLRSGLTVRSGFTPHPSSAVHDKLLHFLTFFFLTLVFYWIVDTTRRRILNMTIIFSLVIDIGSEVLQSFIPVPS